MKPVGIDGTRVAATAPGGARPAPRGLTDGLLRRLGPATMPAAIGPPVPRPPWRHARCCRVAGPDCGAGTSGSKIACARFARAPIGSIDRRRRSSRSTDAPRSNCRRLVWLTCWEGSTASVSGTVGANSPCTSFKFDCSAAPVLLLLDRRRSRWPQRNDGDGQPAGRAPAGPPGGRSRMSRLAATEWDDPRGR